MESIIKLNNLSKSYGNLLAVDSISFEIPKGEMFGMVGPDGAGKTSTIRTLCGLTGPTGGNAQLFGLDVVKERKEIQKRIGYLSQKFSLYGDLSVDENIEFFAEINGVKKFEKRRDELLEFTRLINFRTRPAEKLSGGMKQKLALACSLIHKPEIIFLDEPTIGVDPVSRRDFWKILSELIKEGLTVFFTTPYLDEAERANRVALMHRGKIIRLDTPENVKNSIGMTLIELVTSDIKTSSHLLTKAGYNEIQLFGDRLNILSKDINSDIEKIKTIISSNGIDVIDIDSSTPTLENVFIHLVQKDYN